MKDLLSSPEIENILENSDFITLLNQASGDRKILSERLNLSADQQKYIDNSEPGEGLLIFENRGASVFQTIFYKGIMPSETGFRFSSGL